MPALYVARATPSQQLAAAARRERERSIAAQARPDTPIASAPASVQSQQTSRLRTPAAPITEPPKSSDHHVAPAPDWFWIVDEIHPPRPRFTIDDIQDAVQRHCEVPHADLVSARHSAKAVRSRHIAMFLAKILTLDSLPTIGRKFGDRDHATVLRAVRKIEALLPRDAKLVADLDAIRRALARKAA